MALGALAYAPTADAQPGCRLTNLTPIDFGRYDMTAPTPLDSVGELTVECAAPTPVRIILGRGLAGHQIPRELRRRNVVLQYNLFLDALRTVIWGDGTEGTQAFVATLPPRQTVRIPIFGRIFAKQQVPPGEYTDRIIASVLF